MSKNNIIVAVLVAISVGLCCLILALAGFFFYQYQASTSSSPQPRDTSLPPTVAAQETSLVPTEAPMPIQTEVLLEPTPNADFNGMRFTFQPVIAQGVLPEIVPAAPGDPGQSFPGDIHPEYTRFTLQGYPLVDTFHKPQIFIYPVFDYGNMDPSVKSEMDNLAQILTQKPNQVENMPFLPLWPAAQFFQANIKYFDFKNGSGVRFLTMYGQAFSLVNNTHLFYTYQGLTTDGQWYIAAVLPVSHPDLPQTGDFFPAEDSGDETYYLDMENQLAGYADISFKPSLLDFDALISSIQIK